MRARCVSAVEAAAVRAEAKHAVGLHIGGAQTTFKLLKSQQRQAYRLVEMLIQHQEALAQVASSESWHNFTVHPVPA